MITILITIITTVALALYLYKKTNLVDNIFSNSAEGFHTGSLSKETKVSLNKRHLLVSFDQNNNAVTLNNANSLPVGVANSLANPGEFVSISLLGCASSTLKMTASAPIKAGELLFTSNNGLVQSNPKTKGTYFQVGTALTDALHEGDTLEVDPSPAIKFNLI